MVETKAKKVWDMTADELAEHTKQYDSDAPEVEGRPMSPKSRLLWERWQQARQESLREAAEIGAAAVELKLDADLLRRADEYAAEHRLTRAEVIAAGLRALLPPGE